MVPNLRIFDSSASVFTSQGLGSLQEAISCLVIEEVNGDFHLEMEYPVTGKRYSDLVKGNIIISKVSPYDSRGEQAFEISEIENVMGNSVNVIATHISYKQSNFPIKNLDTRTGSKNQASKIVEATEEANEEASSTIIETVKGIFTAIGDAIDKEDPNLAEWNEQGTRFTAKLIGKQRIVLTCPTGTQYTYSYSGGTLQDIVQTSTGMEFTPSNDGTLTVNASSESGIIVKYKYKVLTFSEIMKLIQNGVIDLPNGETSPFTFSSDPELDTIEENLEEDKIIKNLTPISIRKAIGEGILGKYECEVVFDNYNTHFARKRGRKISETGFEVRYGKNLLDFTKKTKNDAIYTAVYPFWFSEKTLKIVQLTEDELPGTAPLIPIGDQSRPANIYVLDLSSNFSDRPPRKKLKEEADKFIKENKFGDDKVTTTVKFEDLSKYPEYSSVAESLYSVCIGDEVRVIIPDKGINEVSECVKTTYDAILDKYTEIELGEIESTVTKTISSQTSDLKATKTYSSKVSASMSNIASGISNGFVGSTVILNDRNPITGLTFDNDGYPNEIIISNGPDIKSPSNSMWIWNHAGLMFVRGGWKDTITSETDVPIAITNDGKINANFISTGALTIESGSSTIFKVDADERTAYLDIKDSNGNQLIKIDSSIPEVIVNATAISAGSLVAIGKDIYGDEYDIINIHKKDKTNQYDKDYVTIDIRDSNDDSLLYVNSLDSDLRINASYITTGSLYIKDSENNIVSEIPIVYDESNDYYIDNDYIEIKNIDASNITTGAFTIYDDSYYSSDPMFEADASDKRFVLNVEDPYGDVLLHVDSTASGDSDDPRVYINADLITTKNLIIPSDSSDNPAYYLASFVADGGITQPKALLDIRDTTGKSLIYVNSGYTGNQDLDISEADPIVYIAGDNIVSGSISNALVKTSYISNENYTTEYFMETPTVTVIPTGFVATIHAERVDDETIIVFRGEYSSISCTITDALDSSVTRTFVPTIEFDNKRNAYYFVVPTYPEDASSGVGDIVELSLTGSNYTTENVVAWYESNRIEVNTPGHNYIITDEEAFINDFKKGGYSGIDGFWYESTGIQLINISKWKYGIDVRSAYPYGIIFNETQVPQYSDSVESIDLFVYTSTDSVQPKRGITIGGDTWSDAGRILLDGTKIELIARNDFDGTSTLTLDPVNGTSCRLTNGIKIQNGGTLVTAYDNTSSLTLAPGNNITFSYSNNTLVINSTGGSSGEFEGLVFVGYSENGSQITKTYTPAEVFTTVFDNGIVAVSDPVSGGDVSFGLNTDWLSSRYIPHDGGVVSVDLSFRGYTTVKDLTVTGPIVGQNGLSVIGGIRGALANAISLQSGGGFYTIFDNTAPLTIAAGSNITFSYSNNTLTINSTGGGGGGGGGDYLPLIGGTLTGAVDGPKFVSTGTTDSANSTDDAAALVTYGGLTVKKNASVKTIRIDNGSTSKGCSLVFNESANCLNFVFSN